MVELIGLCGAKESQRRKQPVLLDKCMMTAISPGNYYACKSEEPNVLASEA